MMKFGTLVIREGVPILEAKYATLLACGRKIVSCREVFTISENSTQGLWDIEFEFSPSLSMIVTSMLL